MRLSDSSPSSNPSSNSGFSYASHLENPSLQPASRKSLEQSLEQLLSPTTAAHYPNRAKQAWLQPLLTKLLNFFTGNQSVCIEQRRDRNGNSFWYAYDPATRSHHQFDTEQEVRIWLDQRFYS
ncbi:MULTISPECIES: hypothetical protein [unclassified Leptolyngbya]|uniref:hypothetical protein n=1 Tax=unclassified Leptolyngbya TaxID=2650499 RepID=UPI001685D330|nr:MULTISPECIES: hypothetical protein [unclassified Leptolyngbya]MBD1910814.1 hypothetical protein [Leptolyngbya sp. FACHB-8]MBD2157617.1 hypothetical protein [Leptolyngbya sp. FACHB-16]